MAGENDVKQTDTIDTRQTTNSVPLSNIPSQTAKRTSLISPQITASPEKLKKFIELKRAQKLAKENKRKAYYLANKDKKLEAFNNFWKKQNEKNAAKYKIEETTFNINENESVKTHVIHMSDFYNKWYNRLEDGDIRQPVRSGLYAIFRDAGFKTNNAVPFKLVDDTRRRVSEMYSQSPEFDARNANMHEMSVVFFKDSYDAIERVNLSPEKRIVTAQKIANLMLKTYSPIPFVKGELDQYADNYVVKNKAVLKDLLQRLNVQNIDKVMEDVNAELARGVENEQPKAEVNSIPNVNNVQENVVSAQPQEPPKEETPKEEPPKEEPPKEEPPKEEPPKEEPPKEEPPKEEPPKEEPPKEEPPKEEPPKEEPTPTVEQKETYKIEETTFNINENESVKSHLVDMPDFYKKWYNRLQDDDITQPVRSGLYAIFRDAGFKTNNAVPFKLVDDTHRRVSEMHGRTPEFNGRSANMHEMATMFFRDSYDAIERARLSPEKRIVTAQKIANLMLKTYSHIPFVKGELDQYADNYVVNNKVVLKDQLQRLDIQNIDKVMEDVDVTLTAVPETEQQKIEDVANSAPNVNETQENVVTTSQQEITKEEPPKEEPPKEEPPKEEPPKEEPPKEEPPKEEPPKEEPPKEEPPKEEPPKEEPPKEELPKEELPKEEPPKEEPPKEEPPKEEPSKVGPEWINMTKFDEKLAVLMQNKALPSNTKKYISGILQEAGVETGGADDPLEYINILNDAYDQKKFPRDVTQSMNDITKQIFISTYNALTKKGISPNNKIETTQKISDVLLKFYSPATLVEPLKKYTQNYVTGDKDILKECLTSLNLPEKEIKAMMEDNKEKQVENPVPQVKPEENNKEKPVENPVPQVKPEENNKEKPVENIAPKTIDENARVSVFTEKLKTFGNMYKVDINSNNIAFDINDAWTLMKSGDKQKVENGQKILGELFKNILKPTFESEKKISYEEHRLPDYSEITKSANELLRSAMFAFTDLYHDPKSQSLFDPTAFGGLNETEISALTKADGLWSMDQRSDEAWKIQSQESKDIAGQWLKEDKPYEKMINEMSALLDADKKGIIERKDVYKKLAAAEWLLVNNEKMMIENPEDPLNPIPNWGNRYWKSITKTREALGISKHISMRDLIQGNYAEAAKAVNSAEFNKTQIKEGVLDPQARSKCDSMDIQREQFATQCASYRLTGAKEEKTVDDLLTVENRVKITVQSENQYEIMKSEAKQYNFVIDKTMSFELTASNQASK